MRTVTALAAVLALALSGAACGQAQDAVEQGQQAVEEAQSQAEEVADTARFCGSLVAMLTQVRSGQYDAAATTATQTAQQVPDEVRADVRTVVEAARAARQQQDPGPLEDPEVRQAADRLREFASDRCNPAG